MSIDKVRCVVYLPPKLLKSLKHKCTDDGRSVSDAVGEAIAQWMSRPGAEPIKDVRKEVIKDNDYIVDTMLIELKKATGNFATFVQRIEAMAKARKSTK